MMNFLQGQIFINDQGIHESPHRFSIQLMNDHPKELDALQNNHFQSKSMKYQFNGQMFF
ncbi:unnamed protein product [Paramecium sonneborni]|uniref:Uncharacterized protein n=1 Tax=Paramecium sonneborni TaxID=65129 RepID=A0A8S1R671_9CILI|nr:unnamed protein product [Paramecium sonneborni]